jgi:hypothetical protein
VEDDQIEKSMNEIASTAIRNSPSEGAVRRPILVALLGSRMILFLVFQAVIALAVSSWHNSEAYWLLTATLTNCVSIMILWYLFRREGRSYSDLFRFSRGSLRKDILIFAGLVLLCGPVVFGPNYLLGIAFWGDHTIPFGLMFRPIDRFLAIVLLFVFPVTIVFAELATYFGYIMPALAGIVRPKWLSVALPVLFLSLQHMTLPFIPDVRFIFYRGLVFLPFAALIGIALYRRPSLFPYFAIMHGLMDMGTAIMFLGMWQGF